MKPIMVRVKWVESAPLIGCGVEVSNGEVCLREARSKKKLANLKGPLLDSNWRAFY